MKMEKVPWNVGWDEVLVRVVWGVRGRERGR